MSESQKVIALTPDQLTEVCVRFAAIMGWIDGPGSDEWVEELHAYSGAQAFHMSLTSARREAVARAAEGITTSLDVLKRLETKDG